MKLFFQLLTVLFFFSILSCANSGKEMKIDADLLQNSKLFEVKANDADYTEIASFGHFSSYEKDFGLEWMKTAGIMDYFDSDDLLTFSTDNNDNYSYDHILSPAKNKDELIAFAEKFELPMEEVPEYDRAYIGYIYAAHDEYSILLIDSRSDSLCGYLSNGFDIYRVFKVFDESGTDLLGYQFKLYDEYVGSLQTKDYPVFRMTTLYCDATEMVVASIASTLIKCEKNKL